MSNKLFPSMFSCQKTNVSGNTRCAFVPGSSPDSELSYIYTARDLEG